MNYSELLQLAKGWGNFVSDRINIWRLRFLTKSSLDGHNNLPSGVFGSYNKHLDRYQSAAGANVSQIHYDVVR